MKINYKISLILPVVLILGCATISRTGRQETAPVFYPPPPLEPRLQFLASFSGSHDLQSGPSAFKKFIVGEVNDFRPIVKPYGIAVRDNKIYLCDTVHSSIDILDLEKRKFDYFMPSGEGRLIEPISLAFAANGNMYVSDSTRGQIVIFGHNDDFIGTIGEKSEFKPCGIIIDNSRIYFCDLKTHSVKIFDIKDKLPIFSIPLEGENEEGKLFSPTNIALDQEGNLYVSDTGAFRVQKYGPEGEFLMSFGSHGDSPGQFARPKGVAVDSQGRVYVADAAFENIQLFDKDARLLLYFAEPGGSRISMTLPAALTIDYTLKDYFSILADPSFELEYLLLATSQYGERKLNIFGFGHKKPWVD